MLKQVDISISNLAMTIVNTAIGMFVGGIVVFVMLMMIFALPINTLEWMSILYPLMTATSFVATIVMALCYSVYRRRIILMVSLFFAAETIVLLLLTLTTGAHPVLSIEQYRPLVASARFFEWVFLLWIIRDGVKLVFSEIKHEFRRQ